MNALEKIQAQYAEDNARVPIAIKLCEQQIADHTPRESWTVENYPASWLAHYQTTLKAWTTHFDEFNEHKNTCQATNQYCVGCRIKAKRLLGEEQ